jgi:hypothetical protein
MDPQRKSTTYRSSIVKEMKRNEEVDIRREGMKRKRRWNGGSWMHI